MAIDRRVQPFVLALAVAVMQVAGSFGAARGQPDRDPVDAVAVALLVVGPLGLVVWRRWPVVPVLAAVAATCTYVGLGYPFGPVFPSVAVAFFLAVQSLRRRVVLALAGAGLVSFLTVVWRDRSTTMSSWVHAVVVVGWLTAVLAVSEIVRVRREQVGERRHTQRVERDRELADERVRLAQELHDVLAHNISLINVQASVALHLIEQQPVRATDALGHIKAASADAIDELRVALDLLRGGDSPTAPAPRLADLGGLVAAVRASGLAVDLNVTEDDGERNVVPAPVELAAYRIVQEALTNVTRHSNADRVTVELAITSDAVEVEVVDDGNGAAPVGDPVGRGLVGMHERARALGGTLDARPTPGGGFRVAAHLPWDQR